MEEATMPSAPARMLALALALLLQGGPGGDAAPDLSPLVGSNWGSPRRFVHLQTSTELNNFYLEIKLDGTVRRSTSRNPYSVIMLKADTRERVAILGVKSSRYLCLDLDGTPFTSVVCLREDCVFEHKLLENNRDVFYSARTGILLNLEGSRQVFAAGHNLPPTSLFLPKSSTVPLERLLLHRERRNRPRDTAEGSDSRAVPEDDAESEPREPGDDGANASRESRREPPAHDPWGVHSSNPSSPRGSGTAVRE
ncbi:fibroblast growth factor 23-like [Syngnathoides biaculeatus]|uniref:fibroblast growth factor 23-like n=1 Tax=Syngnathoides biaculeatus TaxID=300417 RepID=UPI002ADDDFDE|nr:fibroblast growth factor 23-like [Syngnathoides biaculeatus]